MLDCSGQSSATSGSATLTVVTPSSVTVSLLPIVGLRPLADVGFAGGHRRGQPLQLFFHRGQRHQAAERRSDHHHDDRRDRSHPAGLERGAGREGRAGRDRELPFSDGDHPRRSRKPLRHRHRHNTIRKIAIDGTVSTLAGSAGVTGAADGSGSAASFNAPTGIAIGPEGDLYVADTGNNLIRRLTTAGVVTTYAGGSGGAPFVDGPASTARFNAPSGVAWPAPATSM